MTQHTVLLYSDDAEVRDRMRMAIGARPAADLQVKFVDATTYGEVVRLVDDTEIDLLVLDGEASPGGGVGIARQLKDEVTDPPPVVLAIARAADRWLAAYARVEGTIMYPLDPVATSQTVSALLRALPAHR